MTMAAMKVIASMMPMTMTIKKILTKKDGYGNMKMMKFYAFSKHVLMYI